MRKKQLMALVMAIVMGMCMLALTGCGQPEQTSQTDEPTPEEIAQMDPDDAELASQAVELNKDEANFFGKWESTTQYAENLYGHMVVNINEDGSVIVDVTDEHLEGTWEKVDGGIRFETELFEGTCYYGKKCKMVITEVEGDDTIRITLKKVE